MAGLLNDFCRFFLGFEKSLNALGMLSGLENINEFVSLLSTIVKLGLPWGASNREFKLRSSRFCVVDVFTFI